MKNFEFYADELRELGLDNAAVNKETGELCACNAIFCEECLLAKDKPENACPVCSNALLDWLLKEHEEPKVDWSKVTVDTLIYVSENGASWIPRYFAKYENGHVYAWVNGATSLTAYLGSINEWKYTRLPTEEEMKND